MRLLTTKIKKTIRIRVLASNGDVKIKIPKQNVGYIALQFENESKSIILKQWELILNGDNLQTVRVK